MSTDTIYIVECMTVEPDNTRPGGIIYSEMIFHSWYYSRKEANEVAATLFANGAQVHTVRVKKKTPGTPAY